MIAELCASGVLLTDNGAGRGWQSRAREQLAHGPKPVTDAERGSRCYGLSALVDDLAGSRDDALAREVLEGSGGYVQEGYLRGEAEITA